MGRVVAPFGVRGWLKVAPFTGEVEALLDYPTWWIAQVDDASRQPYRVEQGRRHGAVLIAKLAGIESPEQAATYSGFEVAVPRDALPVEAADEVYWDDLEGCSVVNRAGEMLGTVAGVTDFGAHAMLRVTAEGGKGERLIPFVPPYIDAVDLDRRRIEVDWQRDY